MKKILENKFLNFHFKKMKLKNRKFLYLIIGLMSIFNVLADNITNYVPTHSKTETRAILFQRAWELIKGLMADYGIIILVALLGIWFVRKFFYPDTPNQY